MTSSRTFKLLIICVIALPALLLVLQLRDDRAKPVAPSPNISVSTHDQYAKINGIELRYRDEGKADKPVLILLHGFSYSLETYDALVGALKDDFRLVRYDFAGHGLTGPDPKSRYTHEDRVNNLRALITHLNLEKPILVGNSLGGIAAWRYTSKYPDDVTKLILIDPGGFPMNGVTEAPVQAPPMVATYLRDAPKPSVTFGVSKLYADPTKIPEGRIDQVIAMMQKPGNGDAMVEIINVFTLPDPTEMLSKIKTPTLIIWGAQDSTIPQGHAVLFEKTMQNARLLMFENVGHTPHEETPKITADAIRSFVKE